MPAVPALRGEQVVRALERAGFKVARISGSHRVMRDPDGRGTTVPVHPRPRSGGYGLGRPSDTGHHALTCDFSRGS